LPLSAYRALHGTLSLSAYRALHGTLPLSAYRALHGTLPLSAYRALHGTLPLPLSAYQHYMAPSRYQHIVTKFPQAGSISLFGLMYHTAYVELAVRVPASAAS
jgi:hypothetical protein